MSVASVGAGSRLELGKVVSDTFSVIQRNLPLFCLSALLLVGAPGVLAAAARFALKTTAPLSAANLLISLVALVCGLVFQAGLFQATNQTLNGRSSNLAEMWRVGLSNALPLLGLTILVMIPVYLGMFLLLVPGILLLLRWAVAWPALVIEHKGIMQAMGRSAALTKDRRGAIFLLYLAIGLIVLAIEFAVLGVVGGGLAGLATAMASMSTPTPLHILMLGIVGPLLGAIFNIITAALVGTLFYHLRVTREGAAAETVAEVFA